MFAGGDRRGREPNDLAVLAHGISGGDRAQRDLMAPRNVLDRSDHVPVHAHLCAGSGVGGEHGHIVVRSEPQGEHSVVVAPSLGLEFAHRRSHQTISTGTYSESARVSETPRCWGPAGRRRRAVQRTDVSL